MNASGKWAVSKTFDLSFFILPVVIGWVYFAAIFNFQTYALPITILVWVVFAQGHFGSTWFVYLDAANQKYYRAHAGIYYLTPILIFLATLAIGIKSLTLLFVLVAIVSFYHVSKQSIGILQMYRGKNKEFDPLEKKAEIAGVFAWGLAFTGYGATQLHVFQTLLGPLLPLAVVGVWLVGACAVAITAFLLYRFILRKENSLPKNLFLLVSLALYLPYLFTAPFMAKTQIFEIATLTSLIPHYMQYMGLVWLINMNKYQENTEFGDRNPFLRVVSGNIFYILALIMGYAAVMGYLYYVGPQFANLLGVLLPSIVSGLMMVHFYIDSFLWRFRNEHVRATTLPFVKPLSR